MHYVLMVVFISHMAGHIGDIELKNMTFASYGDCLAGIGKTADALDTEDPDHLRGDMYVDRTCREVPDGK